MKYCKPFTDCEIVRECLIQVGSTAFDGKELNSFLYVITSIPQTDSTTSRRAVLLSQDTSSSLVTDLQKVGNFALALDESTDHIGQ